MSTLVARLANHFRRPTPGLQITAGVVGGMAVGEYLFGQRKVCERDFTVNIDIDKDDMMKLRECLMGMTDVQYTLQYNIRGDKVNVLVKNVTQLEKKN